VVALDKTIPANFTLVSLPCMPADVRFQIVSLSKRFDAMGTLKIMELSELLCISGFWKGFLSGLT
jgi:hypothetical protein